ncbi:unnamed protein product [Rotaria socialis]|uniref:Uncharacterized protein n=1 Tax=Rotaria socialis TaxID=392032 RepID=A0A818BWP4_9BILA|nr:unnamed protein product [Rotaria socialis]CAF3421577.1 unnamed protein product [Rotaria socialis]CAF4360244.1 unnamed protein product [Rotaria socialis]CAF4516176.1 unnamed protein product [Rotaria socialis]
MPSSTNNVRSYSQSKLSMLVFGSYMIIVGGIGFSFFPYSVSSLVGLKTTDDTYIRLFGLLAGILGINYFVMVETSCHYFLQTLYCYAIFSNIIYVIFSDYWDITSEFATVRAWRRISGDLDTCRTLV